MAVAFVSQGTTPAGVGTGTGSTSVAPDAPASLVDGNIVVLIVENKPDTANPTTPTDWTLIGTVTGGGGTQGNDTGPSRTTAYYRVKHPGWSAMPTVTVTSGNASTAQAFQYSNASGLWSVASAGGADTTADTSWSVTCDNNPGITAGDMILVGSSVATDARTWSAEAVSATGISAWGTMTERSEPKTTTGQDIGGFIFDVPANTGTSSAAPVVTATADAATNATGASLLIRLREVAGTYKSASTLAEWNTGNGTVTVQTGVVSGDTCILIVGGATLASNETTVTVTPSKSGVTFTEIASCGATADNNQWWYVYEATGLVAADSITVTMGANRASSARLWALNEGVGTPGTIYKRGGTSLTTTVAPSMTVSADQKVYCISIDRNTTGGTTISTFVNSNGREMSMDSYVKASATGGQVSFALMEFIETGTTSGTTTATYTVASGNGASFHVPIEGGTDGTATPAVIAVTTALPAASLSVGSTLTPAAITAPLALPSVTTGAGSSASPAALAVTISIPAAAASGSGSAAATPAVIAVPVSLPAPAVSTGSTASPAVIAATVTLPAATLGAGSSTSPAVIPITIALPAATASGAATGTATPAVITCTATLPAPTATGGGTATPATVPLVLTIPAASAQAPATATPAAIPITLTTPAPTVHGGGGATPGPVAIVTAVPNPGISAGATVNPATIALAITLAAAIASGTPPDLHPVTVTVRDQHHTVTVTELRHTTTVRETGNTVTAREQG